MKKLFLVLGLAVLFCFAGTSANAAPLLLFEQDNFHLFYNNSPGEANTQFLVTGDLKDWNANTILYNFTLTGSNTNGAQHVGNEYFTTYDQATLTIRLPSAPGFPPGALQWTGTGSLFTEVHDVLNADGDPVTTYPASNYSRPVYVDQPTDYFSVGAGQFTGAAGQAITDTILGLPWFGTYNWGYGGQLPGVNYTHYQFGNTQGELTNAVPEPATMFLLGSGLVGLAGFARKRFLKK